MFDAVSEYPRMTAISISQATVKILRDIRPPPRAMTKCALPELASLHDYLNRNRGGLATRWNPNVGTLNCMPPAAS
jgi:hypothetical protein